MRWDGGGDDGVDDEDGVDDDPDDARRDGDDDGGDSPPSEREIPRQISPCRSSSFLSLVSASWRRRKNSSSMPTMFLIQGSILRRRGAGEGPQGPGAGPTRASRWARGRGRPCPLLLASSPPFGSVTY